MLSRKWIALALAALIIGVVAYGINHRRHYGSFFGGASGAPEQSSGKESKAASGNPSEKVAQAALEEQRVQRQINEHIQQDPQRANEQTQRTLRTIQEINQMNRTNQQLQQQFQSQPPQQRR